jgi:hypothetical protein
MSASLTTVQFKPPQLVPWAHSWRHDYIPEVMAPECDVWTPADTDDYGDVAYRVDGGAKGEPHWHVWDPVALHDLDVRTFFAIGAIMREAQWRARRERFITRMAVHHVSFPGVPITQFGFRPTERGRKHIDESTYRQIKQALESLPLNPYRD